MMSEAKTIKPVITVIILVFIMCTVIWSTGCTSDTSTDPNSDSAITDELDDNEQVEEAVLPRDESDEETDSDIFPTEDAGDITGTYVGIAKAIETEYFKIKRGVYITQIEVGTIIDIEIQVSLDETTGQYYIDGVMAEKTETPDREIHLVASVENEGSMSMTSTTSLNFKQNRKDIAGTMVNITYIYGAVTASETWSIVAIKN